MFRKLTIALLATTLLASPVLAQSTVGTARAPLSHPAKIVAVKTTGHAAKPMFAKGHKVTKVKKHKVKKIKVAKHVKHMAESKHRIHLSAKPAAPSHHN